VTRRLFSELGCNAGIVVRVLKDTFVFFSNIPRPFVVGVYYFRKDYYSPMTSSYKSTFSLVARDPDTGQIAVGGGTYWFAYAIAVPFIEAGVGAVATQATTNSAFGPKGLALLKSGLEPKLVVEQLLAEDSAQAERQLLVINNQGLAAGHTGASAIKFARHICEENLAVAGNMMANAEIVPGMVNFWHSSDLPFAERIIKTLQHAQSLGGDVRGKRSAGLLVAKAEGTGAFWNDIIYNLRIDDAEEPFQELERLHKLASAYLEMNRGDTAFFDEHDNPKALHHYGQALKLASDNPEVQFWYAKLQYETGNKGEADKVMSRLVSQDPRWQDLWDRLTPPPSAA
jgi:uncharacterized Ntn-hydrolase superfamily protein